MIGVRLPTILVILASRLVFCATAAKQDIDNGVPALARGGFARALRERRQLAEHEHSKAQHIVGVMRAQGIGVPQNNTEGLYWYRLASEEGNTNAHVNLGLMYAWGAEVPLKIMCSRTNSAIW